MLATLESLVNLSLPSSQFPKWMLDDQDLQELGVLYCDTHLEGIKRYRDFDKFHSALLSTPSLTGFSKGSLKLAVCVESFYSLFSL